MQPKQKKTAVGFHAKDDLPEVRREVFRLLDCLPFRFFAVMRDKTVIAQKVNEQNCIKPTYRYHPNQLYDRCISALLKERLHKGDSIKIYFARRGTKDRTEALLKAIEAAHGISLEMGCRRGLRRSKSLKPTAIQPSVSRSRTIAFGHYSVFMNVPRSGS